MLGAQTPSSAVTSSGLLQKGLGEVGRWLVGPGEVQQSPEAERGGRLVPLQNPGARRAGADSRGPLGFRLAARPFAAGGQPSPGLGDGSASQLRLEALELAAESLTSATPPGFWIYPLGPLFFKITSPQHPFLKRVMSPDNTHTHTHTHTSTSLLPKEMREMMITFFLT